MNAWILDWECTQIGCGVRHGNLKRRRCCATRGHGQPNRLVVVPVWVRKPTCRAVVVDD
jgi:hypothetical protein